MMRQNSFDRSTIHFNKTHFGSDFTWGVASSAYQVEGAHLKDGRGWSIWDEFTNIKEKARHKATANEANGFYHYYRSDLDLMKALNFRHFRYSLAWPRILPNGTGEPNSKGLDFYKQLVDACLERDIEPWLTLYHWDLPHQLEKAGGWTNRDIVGWFLEYVSVCIHALGDRVSHWMVFNEPNVFTGAGYGLGMHAPGRRGVRSFLKAFHHALLAQAEGERLIHSHDPQAKVGTTFSVTPIDPQKPGRDDQAAYRVHTLVNRLGIEPLLGFGYPYDTLPFLKRIKRYMKPGDEHKIAASMDFIGVQPYTREVVKRAFYIPFIHAWRYAPSKRDNPLTAMGWEIYPQAVYRSLTWLYQYPLIPDLYITENGIALHDKVEEQAVHDDSRIQFYEKAIYSLMEAKREGVPVKGYFAWTFTDNFEWAEGYEPRFGLVYVDFKTQQRIPKASARWFSRFLADS